MFEYLQISNVRERYLVGLADIVLRGVAPLMRRRPSRSGGPARRILLLRLERIGDLLMALQAIRDVRRQAPQAQIDLIVGSWNAALANAIGDLDGVEPLDVSWMTGKKHAATWATLLSTAWTWRRRRYDLEVNLEGDIRSNLLLGVSAAGRRVGFSMRGGGPLLTDPVDFSRTAHTATNIRRLVQHAVGKELGELDHASDSAPARLQIPEEATARAEALLARSGATGMLIGIQASAGQEIKQWDPDRFAQVGTVLAREYDATLVITGTEGERHLTERVKRGVGEHVRTVDLTADIDLPMLGGIIERLALLLTCAWARPPRREKFLKRHIPGLAGIHPGIRRSADPTTDRGQSYMALSKPRTTEPGSRDDHADTGRHLAPGATHLPGAAPVTAEIA